MIHGANDLNAVIYGSDLGPWIMVPTSQFNQTTNYHEFGSLQFYHMEMPNSVASQNIIYPSHNKISGSPSHVNLELMLKSDVGAKTHSAELGAMIYIMRYGAETCYLNANLWPCQRRIACHAIPGLWARHHEVWCRDMLPQRHRSGHQEKSLRWIFNAHGIDMKF